MLDIINSLTYITDGGKRRFIISDDKAIVYIRDILKHEMDIFRILLTIVFLMQAYKSIKKVFTLIPVYANFILHVPNVHSVNMLGNIIRCDLYSVCGLIEIIDLGCVMLWQQEAQVKPTAGVTVLKKKYTCIQGLNSNSLRSITTLIPMTTALFNQNIGLITQMHTNDIITVHRDMMQRYMNCHIADVSSSISKIKTVIGKLKKTKRARRLLARHGITRIVIHTNLCQHEELFDDELQERLAHDS